MANAFSVGKKRRAKPTDFIPEWDQKPQTWRDQLATVHQLNRAFGGTVKGAGSGNS